MERLGGSEEGSQARERAEGIAASLCTLSGCPARGEGEE